MGSPDPAAAGRHLLGAVGSRILPRSRDYTASEAAIRFRTPTALERRRRRTNLKRGCMRGKWLTLCAIAVATLAAGRAGAQSTLGYGSAIVIPLVAHTVSLRPRGVPPLAIERCAADGRRDAGGGHDVGGTRSEELRAGGGSCHMAAHRFRGSPRSARWAPALTHFGYLVLQDSRPRASNPIFAFRESQNPQAMGFSVEGFPAGGLSAPKPARQRV